MSVVKYCPRRPVTFLAGGYPWPYTYCPKEKSYYRFLEKERKWKKMLTGMVVTPESVQRFFDTGNYELLTPEQKETFPPFKLEHIAP